MITSRFPSFFEHLECSQHSSSCSIFFPWIWGFFRVVKHHCRLIYSHLVAVFRGQVERKKIRKMLNSSSFWHTPNFNSLHLIFIFCLKNVFFLESCILLQVPVSKWPGKTKIFNPISEFIEKNIFQVPQNVDFTLLFLIFNNLPYPLKTATNWV